MGFTGWIGAEENKVRIFLANKARNMIFDVACNTDLID